MYNTNHKTQNKVICQRVTKRLEVLIFRFGKPWHFSTQSEFSDGSEVYFFNIFSDMTYRYPNTLG